MTEPDTPEWPKVGDKYVWECFKPHAAIGVVVMELQHNGEEWVVRTRCVTNGNDDWNSLDRFQEACKPFRDAVGKAS